MTYNTHCNIVLWIKHTSYEFIFLLIWIPNKRSTLLFYKLFTFWFFSSYNISVPIDIFFCSFVRVKNKNKGKNITSMRATTFFFSKIQSCFTCGTVLEIFIKAGSQVLLIVYFLFCLVYCTSTFYLLKIHYYTSDSHIYIFK